MTRLRRAYAVLAQTTLCTAATLVNLAVASAGLVDGTIAPLTAAGWIAAVLALEAVAVHAAATSWQVRRIGYHRGRR